MRVRIIEPSKADKSKIKVCAYARVSTDKFKQEESMENQVAYYERTIKSNPEYEFVGVFTDQGITGYHENRPGFQSMIAKARNGEIDMIMVKSISRLARNTVTVLKTARELKELGIGIFFEEQNINTLSGDGEMMLAVLSSFAQEESRSMSENNKWSIKKRFERGEPMLNTKRFMGFDMDYKGNIIINEEEAKIVRMVFELYLSGLGAYTIAKKLNERNVPTVTGAEWHASTVRTMLKNEKYKGDILLQKWYTPETKRNHVVKNRGQVDCFYINENHPAIISIEDWDKVQQRMKQGAKSRNIDLENVDKYKNSYPLTGMLFCGKCGKRLRRNHGYGDKIKWVCSTYVEKGKQACEGIRIPDEILSRKNIKEPTIIEEEIINGEKHYTYTSKSEYDRRNLSCKPAKEN